MRAGQSHGFEPRPITFCGIEDFLIDVYMMGCGKSPDFASLLFFLEITTAEIA